MAWSETNRIKVMDSQINPGIENAPFGDYPDCPDVKIKPETDLKTKDPWAGRTSGMKCRTCVFYVEKKSELTIEIGRCRRNAPTMKGYPIVYPDDWCGEHRMDEEKLLCG